MQQQPRLTPARLPARPPAEAAIWLLQHGADVNTKKDDAWQDTPLHYAAARSKTVQPASAALDVLRALIAYGADVSAANFHGATPADLAQAAGSDLAAVHLRQVPAQLPACWAVVMRCDAMAVLRQKRPSACMSSAMC
jgi:hypothetical protein